ncbi:MAG TPA: UDP-N-acetylmuramoyl-L-alanine--D-glutamate ligase [Humidesulfovibrio sp.]|uniref:UDP-N-acetylmuramoyl-L-alanine--D-glutamate ligase n=1 Tax=Humidesulfovibrio sp. TaxID=2910988 RepID=UPI002CD078C5|nr:UDP-N-acetylmuramoyl-L-alanine--D-glutamate ligase [Humidesulfovibrio sp.]HWR02966.1 UDP-N-acetylmuramoyl-L-alanine--D-glutamate ligase [Humidesulfovibrio sp.]
MDRRVAVFQSLKIFENRQAVVVGAGVSGLAACRFLLSLGARVRLVDAKADLPQDVLLKVHADPASVGLTLSTGAHTPAQFNDAHLIVLSPGVPVKKLAPVLKDVDPARVVAEMEFASWFLTEPVIAITGTNGKTTTTTLVGHILEHAGLSTFVGGNIGTPLCDYLMGDSQADVLVIEISSFQLQNCRSFKPRVAALLNFSANHLDYHLDMEEYLSAKLQLFARQDHACVAVIPESMREELTARNFTKARIDAFTSEAQFDCPGLPGAHNRENIAAAWRMVRPFGVTEAQARAAIAAFKALPHRIEPVGEAGGVLFVNDSKATTLDSVCAAVKSFERPVRLLLGGVFKGGDVASLLPVLTGRVESIGLFGASREVFEPVLAPHFPVSWDQSLEAAVRRQFALAKPGDVILLSPATASFDAYSGYTARGRDFARVAQAIAAEAGGAK